MKTPGLISSFVLLIITIFVISIVSLFLFSASRAKSLGTKHGEKEVYTLVNTLEKVYLNEPDNINVDLLNIYINVMTQDNFHYIEIKQMDKTIVSKGIINLDNKNNQDMYIRDSVNNISINAVPNVDSYYNDYNTVAYYLLIFDIILGLFLGISSFIYLNHFIVKPLKSLMKAVGNSENGFVSRDIDGYYPREISSFSRMFSNILKDVNEKKSALEDYSSLLEFKVQSRTWELEKTIEDLKSTKSVLFHQEKMASIGLLAAGVAHEINNPAGYVKTNIEVMLQYMTLYKKIVGAVLDYCNTENPELLEKLKDISREDDLGFILKDSQDLLLESIDGIKRISKIVMGLKEYSREDKEEAVYDNINEAIEKALSISWNNLKYKATINKSLGEIPRTYCFLDKLTQVVVNLLMNAVQAIKEKGEINIDTWADGNFIYIRIQDTGEGMPDEIKNNIFDPFFTTKSVGVGTGLGLSISQGIVEKHGGKIQVDSKLGQGSVFTINIPIKKEKS